MPLDIVVRSTLTGPRLNTDAGWRTPIQATMAQNLHGCADVRMRVPVPLDVAAAFADRPNLVVEVVDDAGRIWLGRTEEATLSDEGLALVAAGYSRAASDIETYTAVWSTTQVSRWQVTNERNSASRSPAMYVMDTNNRLFIGLKKNASYRSNLDIGSMHLMVPQQSSRLWQGLDVDLEMVLPVGWTAVISYATIAANGYGAISASGTIASITGTGALLTRALHLEFAANARTALVVSVINATAGTVTFAGEDGTNYLKLTNLRAVTSVANRITTTLTAARAAGTSVTTTVGSTAGMYVGQRLIIDSGSSPSESVTVESVLSATQFVATFANSYVIGDTVQAHRVTPDEIVKDVRALISTVNPSQLAATDMLIAAPGVDLEERWYEDRVLATILDELAAIGDTSGTVYEWGVGPDGALYYRPGGSEARTWYVDAISLESSRSLTTLKNVCVVTYEERNGGTARTAASLAAGRRPESIEQYGIERRGSLSARTTSSTEAAAQQTAYLNDRDAPASRTLFAFEAIYDVSGSRWPLWVIRGGDRIVARNLPLTLTTDLVAVQQITVARATYDMLQDAMQIETATPPPSLTTYLARVAARLD